MKGYQRPEDLAGAGVIIEQFRRKLLPAVRAGSIIPDVSAGGRRLTVNALHKCSHVPVELLRGLHKGNVSTMIVIDARACGIWRAILSEEADKTIRSSFPWIINEGTLIASSTAPLSNSRINMPWREAGRVTELKPTR